MITDKISLLHDDTAEKHHNQDDDENTSEEKDHESSIENDEDGNSSTTKKRSCFLIELWIYYLDFFFRCLDYILDDNGKVLSSPSFGGKSDKEEKGEIDNEEKDVDVNNDYRLMIAEEDEEKEERAIFKAHDNNDDKKNKNHYSLLTNLAFTMSWIGHGAVIISYFLDDNDDSSRYFYDIHRYYQDDALLVILPIFISATYASYFRKSDLLWLISYLEIGICIYRIIFYDGYDFKLCDTEMLICLTMLDSIASPSPIVKYLSKRICQASLCSTKSFSDERLHFWMYIFILLSFYPTIVLLSSLIFSLFSYSDIVFIEPSAVGSRMMGFYSSMA